MGGLRRARDVQRRRTTGSPTGREPYGDGVPIVVAGVTTCQGGRESRATGRRGTGDREVQRWEACVMQSAETVLDVIRASHCSRGRDHWRAGCRETGMSCVRREALRCIPDAVRRNLEERSWVAWLTWTRKREGTRACQGSGGRLEASRATCRETRAIRPRLDCLKPNLQW